MNRGSDVFTTLMWGLRRYAWMVAIFVLAIGVLVPTGLNQRTPTFEARAQVGPTLPLQLNNADPLPRIGESLFNNGAVEQSVRKLLRQPNGNIIPAHVKLIAAQDNLVLEVVAHADNAQEAIAVANMAAATFVTELNRYSQSVAPFLLQHRAVQAKKIPKIAGGSLSIAFGLIAGLVAGVGFVALLLVLRRPVVDSSAAEDSTGAPVLGRISLPKGGGHLEPADLMGIGLLCRRILSTQAKVVYLAGPVVGHLNQLGDAMQDFMTRVRQARDDASPDDAGDSVRRSGEVPEIVVLDGPSLELWARVPSDSSTTLLLIPEGIGARRLRTLAEEHFTGTPAGVVLMTTHRRSRGAEPPAASPAEKPQESKDGSSSTPTRDKDQSKQTEQTKQSGQADQSKQTERAKDADRSNKTEKSTESEQSKGAKLPKDPSDASASSR